MQNGNDNESNQSNNSSKKKSLIDWTQIISGLIVGIILGGGGAFYLQVQRIAKLETQIEELNKTENQVVTRGEQKNEQIQSEVNPKELITIIKDQQASYVKDSWGPESYQCFTDVDLDNFNSSKIPEKISYNLKKDAKFIDLVLAIKQMPASKWKELKEICLKTYKPTWAEQGGINKNGQTDAGQKAEKKVANTIVKLVVELLEKSVDEIKNLYSY
jgi:hypothetical protein